MSRDQKNGDHRVIPVLLEGDSGSSIPIELYNRERVEFLDKANYLESRAALAKRIMPEARDFSGQETPPGGVKLILVADVDGFSEMDTLEQQDIMGQIWKGLAEIGGGGLPGDAVFPILDGFGIVWGKVLSCREVVATAQAIVNRVLTKSGRRALRCGINHGLAMAESRADGGRPHFYGSGINDAGRACGLGDAGDVILTEAFWRHARDTDRNWEEMSDVKPSEQLPGITVFPQRAQGGTVRVFQPRTAALPSRLEMRKRAEVRFKSLITEVAWEFAEALEAKYGVDIDNRSVRVTFWRLPVQGAVTLWFSGTRLQGHLREPEKNEAKGDVEVWEMKTVPAEEGSRIRYSIIGDGEGPVGMAWQAARDSGAVVAHNLPLVSEDDETSRKTYEMILERDFNLKPKTASEFGRHSRLVSACAFPMPHVASVDPQGVLCIDMDVELPPSASRPELEDMLVVIMQRYSTDLFLASAFRG